MRISTSHYCFIISAFPLRSPAIDIHPNAKWIQNGLTVAGGNGYGSKLNQLWNPRGLYVDDDQTIYVGDPDNHRIVEWKYGATSGNVVVDGLRYPTSVIIDKERESFIIGDPDNQIVVRCPCQNSTNVETIISNISCGDLTIDENGFLYVSDYQKHEVRRYRIGDSEGTLVAGGNGEGDRLDQLTQPGKVFVNRDHSVYVSDSKNNRVMKWEEGAKEGIVVAGGHGEGNNLKQLNYPQGIVVDQFGTIYVVDCGNHRIMRWPKGGTEGSIIAGGNSRGQESNQIEHPGDLSFDRYGNLYVVDRGHRRVQKFNIE